jgi:glycosyl transferase family 25
MTSQAARSGISFERFNAVNGERVVPPLRGQFYADEAKHEPEMSPGEIGCYASHLSIHQIVANDDANDFALILEDDVCLPDDLTSVIEAVRALEIEWDIIQLANLSKWVFVPVASLGGGRELVRYWEVPNNAAGYLISRSGAAKFFNAFPKRTLPIDEDLRRPWRHGLSVYGVLPPPIHFDVYHASSIDSMGGNRRPPARKRFRDAAPHRDTVPANLYRLATFGVVDFCRAVVRLWICGVIEVTRGQTAARKFNRLKPRGQLAKAASRLPGASAGGTS